MKFKDLIAIFPIKPSGTLIMNKGNVRYVDLSPFVAFYDGTKLTENRTALNEDIMIVLVKMESMQLP